jgi:hypothetical protein
MDSPLMNRLRHLPKDCDEQREILRLLDCHFMSTAMLRISQTPAEQRVVLEQQILNILETRAKQPTA